MYSAFIKLLFSNALSLDSSSCHHKFKQEILPEVICEDYEPHP